MGRRIAALRRLTGAIERELDFRPERLPDWDAAVTAPAGTVRIAGRGLCIPRRDSSLAADRRFARLEGRDSRIFQAQESAIDDFT